MKVREIHADRIEVWAPLDQSWPAGTKLFPLRTAELREPPALRRANDDLIVFNAEFSLIEPYADARTVVLPMYRDWPVLDLGTHPNIPAKDWSLSVEGLVHGPMTLNYADLQAIPQTERVSDIHCVTFWSRLDNRWRGVATLDLLAEVRPREEARFALVKSYDGYTTGLPLEYLEEPDSLLVTHWNDAPLTREHGGPVRLVVPSLYFWKSAKWIRSIRLVDRDVKGFWESRGYHMLGDPWREQRYG